MQTMQMALLLDRLFTLEAKPVKERTPEEKQAITAIRVQLGGALTRIFETAGVKEKDRAAYADAVMSDHE